jgi:hypothetical protein
MKLAADQAIDRLKYPNKYTSMLILYSQVRKKPTQVEHIEVLTLRVGTWDHIHNTPFSS